MADIRRRWKVRAPRGFLEHAGTPRGIGGDDAVARERIAFEFMLNALRLNEGFDVATFESRTGLTMGDIAAPLAIARERGLLDVDNDRIRASEFGRRFLNDLIALFLPDSPHRRSAA